jgi:hypothetical protein
MNIRHRWGFRAIAVFTAFAIAQISVQLSFAAPEASPFAALAPQGIIAKVISKGGGPIMINGISSPSGTTVPSGSIIEAIGTEATLDLGVLGSIDLKPGAKIKIEYECPPEKQDDPNPDDCKVKTTVLAGCIVANYNQGTHHDVEDENKKQTAESDEDKEKKGGGGGIIPFCAGGPVGIVPSTGLGWPALGLLIAGGLILPPVLIVLFDEPDNSSDVTPGNLGS